MLSLALNLPVPADIAMTGELNLDGRICRLSSRICRGKVLSATEGGYKHIILPTNNKAQWDNIEQHAHVKENLLVNFVSKYEEIYKIIF